MSDETRQRIIELDAAGTPHAVIAELTGVDMATIGRLVGGQQ